MKLLVTSSKRCVCAVLSVVVIAGCASLDEQGHGINRILGHANIASKNPPDSELQKSATLDQENPETLEKTPQVKVKKAVIAAEPSDTAELKSLIEGMNAADDVAPPEMQKRREMINVLRSLDPEKDAEIYNYAVVVARSKYLPREKAKPENDIAGEPEKTAAESNTKAKTVEKEVEKPAEPAKSNIAEVPAAPPSVQPAVPAAPAVEPVAYNQPIPESPRTPNAPSTPNAPFPPGYSPAASVPGSSQGASNVQAEQQGHPQLTNAGYTTTQAVPNNNQHQQNNQYNGSNFSAAYGMPMQNGNPDDWEALTRNAIESLKTKLSLEPGNVSDEARLRLLELVVRNQREAVRPISAAEEPIRDFWSNHLLGLSTLLNDESIPQTADRYAAANLHVSEGARHLQSLCPMKIRNMQFVDEWKGFGMYRPIGEEFVAGELLPIYFEIENLGVKETALGFNTRFKWSVEIRDGNGAVIMSEAGKQGEQQAERVSRSRTRDNCVFIPIPLPKKIAPAPYFVKVTIRDLNHPKLQEDSCQIEFRIKSFAE